MEINEEDDRNDEVSEPEGRSYLGRGLLLAGLFAGIMIVGSGCVGRYGPYRGHHGYYPGPVFRPHPNRIWVPHGYYHRPQRHHHRRHR